MKFSRRFPVSDPALLPKIERLLRSQDVSISRQPDGLRAELFRWSAFFATADGDQLSWRSVRIEHHVDSLHLRFEYNWALHGIVQVLLSLFVFALVTRFGDPSMLGPVLGCSNGFFLVVSALFALLYAERFSKELSGVAVPATLSP